MGMPRSGTTLMRSILNAHPSLALAPETHLLDHWMQVHRRTDLTDAAGFASFWSEFAASPHFRWTGLDADEVEGLIKQAGTPSFRSIFDILLTAYAARLGKPRPGEKTPGNYRYLDTLLDWYPHARVLYMVRDPRGVVASWEAHGRPWTDKPLVTIASRWRRAAERAERWARDDRVAVVRYEALATAPEPELRRICEHLDEPFAAAMIERPATADDIPSPDTEVSTVSIERWRTELTNHEIAVTEHLTAAPMARLGYERSLPALPRRTRLQLSAQGLQQRAAGVGRRLARR